MELPSIYRHHFGLSVDAWRLDQRDLWDPFTIVGREIKPQNDQPSLVEVHLQNCTHSIRVNCRQVRMNDDFFFLTSLWWSLVASFHWSPFVFGHRENCGFFSAGCYRRITKARMCPFSRLPKNFFGSFDAVKQADFRLDFSRRDTLRSLEIKWDVANRHKKYRKK